MWGAHSHNGCSVEARDYVRSSFSQRVLSMTRKWSKDHPISTQVHSPLSYPIIYSPWLDCWYTDYSPFAITKLVIFHHYCTGFRYKVFKGTRSKVAYNGSACPRVTSEKCDNPYPQCIKNLQEILVPGHGQFQLRTDVSHTTYQTVRKPQYSPESWTVPAVQWCK